MSYFDHVRCNACKAMLDPESLGSVPGQGLSCPRCGAALSLTDLFGIADAFSEEEGPEMSLDDAMPSGPLSASAHDPTKGMYPPTTRQGRASAGGAPAKPAPASKPAAGGGGLSAVRGLLGGGAASPRGGTAMVHKPSADEDTHRGSAPPAEPSRSLGSGDSPSALDIMRSMKKKKK